MQSDFRMLVKVVFIAAAAAGMAACGSLSKNIARDGTSAEELVWPSPDDTTPMHDGGTTPTLDSLRLIHAGMDKNQIAGLIGYPHFHEGVAWSVREWDYLFHLRHDGRQIQCQYKILFDKDKLAQSFYWKPASCADLLHEPKAEATAETFTLSADALFAFDSADLRPEGEAALDKLASSISEHQTDIKAVRIVGYTDVMGSKSYNGLLSRQRAFSVMRYLQDKGVPEGLMTATGLGMADPVKTGCNDDSGRAARIACLAPNRRVEVKVFGKG